MGSTSTIYTSSYPKIGVGSHKTPPYKWDEVLINFAHNGIDSNQIHIKSQISHKKSKINMSKQ